ncbi:hypothetical protein ALT1644_40025 [Alteromonas macleodii]
MHPLTICRERLRDLRSQRPRLVLLLSPHQVRRVRVYLSSITSNARSWSTSQNVEIKAFVNPCSQATFLHKLIIVNTTDSEEIDHPYKRVASTTLKRVAL